MKPMRVNVTHRSIDVGFQAYLLSIYRYMGLGLALTGGVAMILASLPPALMGLASGFSMVGMLATLGIAVYLSFAFQRLSVQRAHTLFWAFAIAQGAALNTIGRAYTVSSIATVFFMTAVIFAVTTIYAQTTKRDLSSIGSLCMMGLFGIIISSVVNLFFQSSALSFIGSLLGCVIFPGLIAYETQKLRQIYYEVPNDDALRQKIAIMGALDLYLSVINLFLSLLRLLGDRK